MYIIYVDESGVPEDAHGSSHFVLVGLAIPVTAWKGLDQQVGDLLAASRLSGAELHTAWMIRRYPEQERIAEFEAASDPERRRLVSLERKKDLAKASIRGSKAVKGLAKNYRSSEPYIHLSHAERVIALRKVADALGSWESARLFGDAHQKPAIPLKTRKKSREMALEQVTTRFNTFLLKTGNPDAMGVMVHDQHQAESLRLTKAFREWHVQGTRFSGITRIAETPLFVDSSLTSMVQLADLASYATRRFLEHGETDLFDRIYGRFDRTPDGRLVGLRHYTGKTPCACRVCNDHGR